MSTQTIASYIKDTEERIIKYKDKTQEGVWFFAVDTGNIFVTYQNGLIRWDPVRSRNINAGYQLGDLTLNTPPEMHLDANNISTMLSTTYVTPSNGDNLGRWSSVGSGGIDLENESNGNAPRYTVDGLGAGLNSVTFNNSSFMRSVPEHVFTRSSSDYTVIMVMKTLPIWDNWDNKDINRDGTNNVKPEWLLPVDSVSNATIGFFQTGFENVGTTSYEQKYTPYMSAGMYVKQTANKWQVTYTTSGGGLNAADGQAGEIDNEGSYKTNVNPLEAINKSMMNDTLIWMFEFSHDGNQTINMAMSQCGAGAYYSSYNTGSGHDIKIHNMQLGSVGEPWTNTGGWFDLGEMLVIPASMSPAEKDQIGNYLATKWNSTWININS